MWNGTEIFRSFENCVLCLIRFIFIYTSGGAIALMVDGVWPRNEEIG